MSSESPILDLADGLGIGDGDVVAAINSYFDESYGGQWFCVAGYVFKKSKLRLFVSQWQRMLHDYGLPYFRMSACNSRKHPFDKLTEAQCIAIATRAIGIIKRHASIGIAIAIDRLSFEKTMQEEVKTNLLSTAYEHCMWMCLVGVRTWADEGNHPGEIAYFFEAGSDYQSKANRLMSHIFNDPTLRKLYRYGGHGFTPKESEPTQAADLLAWHFRKERARMADDQWRPARKDYISLVELTHQMCVYQPEEMYKSRAEMLKQFPAGLPVS